jgi:hypothetical protein
MPAACKTARRSICPPAGASPPQPRGALHKPLYSSDGEHLGEVTRIARDQRAQSLPRDYRDTATLLSQEDGERCRLL